MACKPKRLKKTRKFFMGGMGNSFFGQAQPGETANMFGLTNSQQSTGGGNLAMMGQAASALGGNQGDMIADHNTDAEDQMIGNTLTAVNPMIGGFYKLGSGIGNSFVKGDKAKKQGNQIMADAFHPAKGAITALKTGNFKHAIPVLGGIERAKEANELARKNKLKEEKENLVQVTNAYTIGNDMVSFKKGGRKSNVLKTIYFPYQDQDKGILVNPTVNFQGGGIPAENGQLMPLSKDAFQVQGNNPAATDDVGLGNNMMVDHNEVIKQSPGKPKIIASDTIKLPGSKVSVAQQVKKLEKQKSDDFRLDDFNEFLDMKTNKLLAQQEIEAGRIDPDMVLDLAQPGGEEDIEPGETQFKHGGNYHPITMDTVSLTAPKGMTEHVINLMSGGSVYDGADMNELSGKLIKVPYPSRKKKINQFDKGGSFGEYVFEIPGYEKELETEPGHGPGSGTFKSGGKSGSGIHIKKSKRGTFTTAAKKHGKGVQEFASQVLSNKGNYSSAMVKKANFAKNASKWKHEDGGKEQPEKPKVIFKGFNDHEMTPEEEAAAMAAGSLQAEGDSVNERFVQAAEVDHSLQRDKTYRDLAERGLFQGYAGIQTPEQQAAYNNRTWIDPGKMTRYMDQTRVTDLFGTEMSYAEAMAAKSNPNSEYAKNLRAELTKQAKRKGAPVSNYIQDYFSNNIGKQGMSNINQALDWGKEHPEMNAFLNPESPYYMQDLVPESTFDVTGQNTGAVPGNKMTGILTHQTGGMLGQALSGMNIANSLQNRTAIQPLENIHNPNLPTYQMPDQLEMLGQNPEITAGQYKKQKVLDYLGNNKDGFLESAALYGPGIANFINAKKLPKVPEYSMMSAIDLDKMTNTAEIQDLLGSQSVASRGIKQASSNAGATQANLAALHANTLKGISGSNERLRNLNASISNQEAGMNMNVDQINTQIKNQQKADRIARKARQMGLSSQAVADIANKYLMSQAQKNKQKLDQQSLEILKAKYGNTGVVERLFEMYPELASI